MGCKIMYIDVKGAARPMSRGRLLEAGGDAGSRLMTNTGSPDTEPGLIPAVFFMAIIKSQICSYEEYTHFNPVYSSWHMAGL